MWLGNPAMDRKEQSNTNTKDIRGLTIFQSMDSKELTLNRALQELTGLSLFEISPF